MSGIYRRSTTLAVDDIDSHFLYEGSWEEIEGSSRQWGKGVMTTQQSGASMSFTFFGSNAILYHTIPSGSGNVVVDVSVDGGAPTAVTNACGGANPVYHDIFFQTPIMADATHTVIVTNRSPTNIPFQFDRVDLQSNDSPSILPMQGPTIAPPAPTSSPTPTSKAQPPPATGSSAAPTTPRPTINVAPTAPAQVGIVPSLPSNQGSNSPPQSTVKDSTSTGQPEVTAPASALFDVVSSETASDVSSMIIVTTDALGATVTQTRAVSGTWTSALFYPSENPTTNNNGIPGASRTSNPIPVILATVFGTIALLLVLFAALICIRRQRRAYREGGPARGLRSRALNSVPYPFRHEAAPPAANPSDEYPVGYTAIYWDEKRNQNCDPSSSPVATRSVSSLNVSQSLLPQTMGVVSPNPYHFNADEESTVVEAAPPAYYIGVPRSERTSLGTSFYV